MARSNWREAFEFWDNPVAWASGKILARLFPAGQRQRTKPITGDRSSQRARRIVDQEAEKQAREAWERYLEGERAALVRGAPYSGWTSDIKKLRRDGQVEEAETLLLECVEAAETQATTVGHGGVPPWYYHQLAILYRKEGRRGDEIQIIERCMSHGGGNTTTGKKLQERLARLKAVDSGLTD